MIKAYRQVLSIRLLIIIIAFMILLFLLAFIKAPDWILIINVLTLISLIGLWSFTYTNLLNSKRYDLLCSWKVTADSPEEAIKLLNLLSYSKLNGNNDQK